MNYNTIKLSDVTKALKKAGFRAVVLDLTKLNPFPGNDERRIYYKYNGTLYISGDSVGFCIYAKKDSCCCGYKYATSAIDAATPSETPRISTETEQITNQSTNTPKPQETARKEPKRTISKMERVHAWQKLGAQGYLMLADASAILAAINAPPIRGDCKIGISTRAKPPNCASREKINILQPP